MKLQGLLGDRVVGYGGTGTLEKSEGTGGTGGTGKNRLELAQWMSALFRGTFRIGAQSIPGVLSSAV